MTLEEIDKPSIQADEEAKYGKLRPVIEKCYLRDQMAEAHRHVENGQTEATS